MLKSSGIYRQRGIYAIINLTNGNQTVYVGSTARSLGERCKHHRNHLRRNKHRNPHLQAAWNKYGPETFQFVVLEIVDDADILIEREQVWLDHFMAIGPVYNMGPMARHPMLGRALPEAHRQHISEAHMGMEFSEEWRRNISKSAKNRPPMPQEERDRISRALRGNQNARRKPYPTFIHRDTGEVIPAGVNLAALCRERGLRKANMYSVVHGHKKSHLGWVLAEAVNA